MYPLFLQVLSTKVKRKYIRGRKICPNCEKEVTNLPRHMKLTHKWSTEDARAVNQVTFQRKQYTWQGEAPERRKQPKSIKGKDIKQTKDYHRKKHCPVKGCKGVTVKMSIHLQRECIRWSAIVNIMICCLKQGPT